MTWSRNEFHYIYWNVFGSAQNFSSFGSQKIFKFQVFSFLFLMLGSNEMSEDGYLSLDDAKKRNFSLLETWRSLFPSHLVLAFFFFIDEESRSLLGVIWGKVSTARPRLGTWKFHRRKKPCFSLSMSRNFSLLINHCFAFLYATFSFKKSRKPLFLMVEQGSARVGSEALFLSFLLLNIHWPRFHSKHWLFCFSRKREERGHFKSFARAVQFVYYIAPFTLPKFQQKFPLVEVQNNIKPSAVCLVIKKF